VIQEQHGAERLILGAGRDAPLHGQVRQERLDFRSPHFPGVSLVVKEDIAANPLDVGLFGANGVMQQPELLPNLVEEFHRALGRRFVGVGHRK
jgi:hypothetical protein